jgi:hypothetical protein
MTSLHELAALIRRNPVECALIAALYVAAWAGSPWVWSCMGC